LWFVLVIISLVNVINLSYNIALFFFSARKHEYISKYMANENIPLEILKDSTYTEVKARFVDGFLRQDGVLVIWLVSHRTSSVIASELVSIMWEDYCRKNFPNANVYNNNDSD